MPDVLTQLKRLATVEAKLLFREARADPTTPIPKHVRSLPLPAFCMQGCVCVAVVTACVTGEVSERIVEQCHLQERVY